MGEERRVGSGRGGEGKRTSSRRQLELPIRALPALPAQPFLAYISPQMVSHRTAMEIE